MKLFIPGEQGQVSTVRDVPAHLFAREVRRAAQRAKDPQACLAQLDGLDFQHGVDKWAALCALHNYGAALPAYMTRAALEDAAPDRAWLRQPL